MKLKEEEHNIETKLELQCMDEEKKNQITRQPTNETNDIQSTTAVH